MVFKLRPHQEEAVDKMRNGTILFGDVGSGKSPTAVAYYVKEEMPRDVYVITTAKKRDSLDWLTEFARFGIGRQEDETRGGVLHIDSWNNLSKYREVRGAFFIFDEQRLVGSGSWSDAFLKIASANRWILLSATPGDTWMDYIPVFIANGFYKNRTEFKRDHVVYSSYTKFPKVERYLNEGKLLKLKHHILVEMPMMRHTTRHGKDVWCDYDVDLFDKVLKKRWNPYENAPLKDVAELFRVMRKVVTSDGSRLEVVKELMVRHPRLIVFYNFNHELEILRSLATEPCSPSSTNGTAKCQILSPACTTSSQQESTSTPSNPSWSASAVTPASQKKNSKSVDISSSTSTTTCGCIRPVAEWNGHKHEAIPVGDRWVYLVQYVAGAEGWNCTETDAMCFYSLPYSYKNFSQAHGRIDRLNTPYTDLYYYYLMSKSLVDQAVRKSLNGKQTFNERRYVKLLVDIDD